MPNLFHIAQIIQKSTHVSLDEQTFYSIHNIHIIFNNDGHIHAIKIDLSYDKTSNEFTITNDKVLFDKKPYDGQYIFSIEH